MLEEPNDPFPVYALALEHLNVNPQTAKQLLDRLLDSHPEYIPAYYHAGQLHWQLGEQDIAIQILKTGVEKSKKAGDEKTAREIQGLLDQFE